MCNLEIAVCGVWAGNAPFLLPHKQKGDITAGMHLQQEHVVSFCVHPNITCTGKMQQKQSQGAWHVPGSMCGLRHSSAARVQTLRCAVPQDGLAHVRALYVRLIYMSYLDLFQVDAGYWPQTRTQVFGGQCPVWGMLTPCVA